MPGALQLGFWNIHGHKHKELGNKLNLTEVKGIIKKHDIFGIVETHANEGSELDIESFKHFIKFRNSSGNRNHGGIAVYINNRIKEGILYIPTQNENIIWCKLKKEFFQIDKDIYLGTVYLSPGNYEKSQNADYMMELEEEISRFSTKGNVILQGDFNARTGNLQEYILFDNDEHIDAPNDLVIDDNKTKRYSQDEHVVDSRGRSLIDICTENNLRILNGRIIGDSTGKKTCFQYNGSSLVDYVITDTSSLHNVQFLTVNPLQPIISDHCQISYGVKITAVKKTTNTTSDRLRKLKTVFINDEARNKIPILLESEEYKIKFEQILTNASGSDQETINHLTKNFSKILNEVGDKAGIKYKKVNKNSQETNPNWFDHECATEKENLRSLGKKLCENPNNNILREHLHMKKKTFRRLCRKKKRHSVETKLQKLNGRDPKKLWRELKNLFPLKSKQSHNNVDIKEAFTHFKNLNAQHAGNDLTTDIHNYTETEQSSPLNQAITTNEVEQAINKLKFGKAVGVDLIPNEIMKCGRDALLTPMTTLFNKIMSSGLYPQEWGIGLITPIHKKGDKSNIENYRGITLLSTLSKLFTSILNQRLNDFLTKRNILKKEQLGFRKDHSTTDCIFILKGMIDKFVKSKPKKKKNLLFTCFVDFRKAFDCIPRKKLFEKIKQAGIDGNFYSILHSMYLNDYSAVKQDGLCTETFKCHSGVKQGCMLSPTLFNLFLSDLPQVLNNSATAEPMKVSNTNFNNLLYADDLVLLAKTASDLQSLLSNLEAYCTYNTLAVNIEKTKVLVFNNNGKRMNNYSFHYNNSKIENVSMYKYLGLTFSAYGNFRVAKQELRKMALKALFQLKAKMGAFFRTSPRITIKLFDSLVKPILLYGSEVWGIDNKLTDINEPIESVHTKFCKLLLGTSKLSVNNACRAEMGRFPLCNEAIFRSIKYWTRLTSNDNVPKLVHLIYLENMDTTKPENWNNKIKMAIQKLGYGNVWTLQKNTSNFTRFLNEIKQRLKDIAFQHWLSEIFQDKRKHSNQSNKLRVYRTFKTKYEYEDYLDTIRNTKHRITFTKLRISNHCLEIEKARHQRPYVKPEDRICRRCNKEKEDEIHFLLRCPIYQEIRNTFLKEMKAQNIFDANTLSENDVFKKIINPNKTVAQRVAKYVEDCFKMRSLMISEIPT